MMSTENQISIRKNDVRVNTNDDSVDIRILPAGDKKRAETFTVERATAVRLRDALDAYLTLDRTM